MNERTQEERRNTRDSSRARYTHTYIYMVSVYIYNIIYNVFFLCARVHFFAYVLNNNNNIVSVIIHFYIHAGPELKVNNPYRTSNNKNNNNNSCNIITVTIKIMLRL